MWIREAAASSYSMFKVLQSEEVFNVHLVMSRWSVLTDLMDFKTAEDVHPFLSDDTDR